MLVGRGQTSRSLLNQAEVYGLPVSFNMAVSSALDPLSPGYILKATPLDLPIEPTGFKPNPPSLYLRIFMYWDHIQVGGGTTGHESYQELHLNGALIWSGVWPGTDVNDSLALIYETPPGTSTDQLVHLGIGSSGFHAENLENVGLSVVAEWVCVGGGNPLHQRQRTDGLGGGSPHAGRNLNSRQLSPFQRGTL